jgi:hypothetical protein
MLCPISASGPQSSVIHPTSQQKQHVWITPYELHCSRKRVIPSGVANHGIANLAGKAFDGCILHVFWS